MIVEGVFILNPGARNEERIKNTIVSDGADKFLRQLFRAEALPADFYIGLTGAVYAFDTASLVNIAAGEPVGNGYSRQVTVRNTVDWDVSAVGGIYRARSKVVNFTASADWSRTWSRMFITGVNAGTAGLVYALSGPTATPQVTLSGAPPSLQYEFWMRQ